MKRRNSSRVQAPRRRTGNKPLSAASNQAKRLTAFLKAVKERGIKPVDDKTLDAMGEVWPEEENVEGFIAWLRKSRREGRY